MFWMWLAARGVSRGTRMSFRLSFRPPAAARVIRLSLMPQAIFPRVPREQGMTPVASKRWEPDAGGAPRSSFAYVASASSSNAVTGMSASCSMTFFPSSLITSSTCTGSRFRSGGAAPAAPAGLHDAGRRTTIRKVASADGAHGYLLIQAPFWDTFRESIPMATAFDVPADLLIAQVSEQLKASGKVSPPEWAPYARTGVHTQKAPRNPDWWWTRLAAVLRKVYATGPPGPA